MPEYTAPLADMNFLVHEVFPIQEVLELPFYSHLTSDIVEPILSEAAKICEQELAPINQSGDKEGCRFEGGNVITPKGFKEAYHHFVRGGWMSLNANPEYGGQGLPKMLQILLDEMLCSANLSFSLYTVLTQGAANALELYGTTILKQIYLPKLISGEWSGTMCLTEAHCGTDLGLIRTKALPQADGNYKLSGTKIFITSGEQDLTANIIHMVLARLPDSPPGVKGLSMFLVPKFLVNSDGSLANRNGVFCGSIEHKMGIKASSTCVMNYENAQGFLVGTVNQGMQTMFSMMNLERINIGLEGLGLSEVAYQNARNYAKERLQCRAAPKTKFPEKIADPIIVHPDIRRMLLTMKAFNEGARCFAAWVGTLFDINKHHPDAKKREQTESLIALFTPVVKAFFTDYGFENCNLGLQVFGGHGYVQEWGMEQFVRDARIAQIYEGTNGIQAQDLVRRKLVLNNGEYLKQFTNIVSEFIAAQKNNSHLEEFITPLKAKLDDLIDISQWIIAEEKSNPNIIGAVAVDYLHLLGLVILAFMWLRMAAISLSKADNSNFYQAKINAARFYFNKLLPRVGTLKQTIKSGSEVLMQVDEELF